MSANTSYRFSPQLVFGVFIILLGVLFTLDNLGMIEAREYVRYWPIFLVIFGIAKASQSISAHGKMFGLGIALLGALMVMDRANVLAFRIRDWWPVILIFVGGGMLLTSWRRRAPYSFGPMKEGSAPSPDSTITLLAVMGGFERKSNSQDFRGAEITAIIGGCEVDLRQASIKEDAAVIHIFAFWGGVEIRVPEEWSVSVEAVPLIGTIEDKTHPPTGGSTKRLIVRGYAIMGGAEISN